MALPIGHKTNFETLRLACGNGDLALMDCRDAKTGEKVAVLCAVHLEGGDYCFTPLAKMFNGDPYAEVIPPLAEMEA